MHTKTATTIRIDETLRVVAARLSDEIDELVETMLVRMRDEAPGFDTAARPELADGCAHRATATSVPHCRRSAAIGSRHAARRPRR